MFLFWMSRNETFQTTESVIDYISMKISSPLDRKRKTGKLIPVVLQQVHAEVKVARM